MDKQTNSKRRIAFFTFTLLSFAVLAVVLVGVVAAFRSVYGVTFDPLTLITFGIVIYSLLASNFLILRMIGKGDPVSVILVYSVLLMEAVASITCMHFDHAFAIPLAFLPLLLGTDFDKHVALSAHFTSVSIVATCMVLFFYNSSKFIFDELSLQMMTLVVNVGMGSLLIFLIKPFSSRMRVLFTSSCVVISFGILGFISAAAVGGKPNIDQMITVGVSVLVGGAISVFAYFCFSPVFERVFNLNTGLRLMELCSFDQPLLKELEEKAPGTFNHSLTVANISERAAYAIGENPNLAKAAALYHDIGKMENPEFFTENQTDGYNPHDDLIPEASVKMITRHTEAGAKILENRGFPKEIVSAALEHHGDSSVGYFYHKAQNITEGTLEEKGYTYLGPKPSTKINAIIMIADIAEAATRSVRPSTREELEKLVDNLVRQKMQERQFDDCPITIRELTKVKAAVVTTLMGVHHERIAYNTQQLKK
ncbi:MAG: HDIG domain-containing protein [Clostridia bacterium]|nr:HDIG domain-containing protein [Clostridia bacterium]